jgi:hypothetical protein
MEGRVDFNWRKLKPHLRRTSHVKLQMTKKIRAKGKTKGKETTDDIEIMIKYV